MTDPNPKPEALSIPSMPPVHRHRCMRCREEFDCRNPGACVAGYDVLPTIRNAAGTGFDEHCPKPEAIVTPYEPAEPLPGVAPEYRHVTGGVVRGDAHPGVGEPDWRQAHADVLDELCAAKDELPGRPEGESLVDGVRRVVEERDALRAEVERWKRIAGWVPLSVREGATTPEEWVQQRANFVEALQSERDELHAEVERLKAAAVAVRESVESWRDALTYGRNGFTEVTRGAIQHFVINTVVDRFGLARETPGNAPPARNDATDVAGEGPAPVEAPAPNAAAESTSYFHAGNITACHPTFAARFPDLAAAMVPPDGTCRCSMWPEPHIHSTLSAAPSRIGPAPIETQGGGQEGDPYAGVTAEDFAEMSAGMVAEKRGVNFCGDPNHDCATPMECARRAKGHGAADCDDPTCRLHWRAR